ncbi:helix-turn-helix transcriptional regulator [Noviluteimonas gilva]|uniref:WYL domain-containing protein n=1 Tax=Noviluteimonas gilva TaxID=2682097 RepID=A0A7C9LK98_9GAMM|nr:WYL domain-containing protein [Lysobacter gilvus]MUV13344.1 WYL domain-containing protein [Lysobacter gilvus]
MAKTPRGHQERVKAVEILLLWEGRVSRPRLAEIFDVHGTVLSRDMAAYAHLVPDNCQYDTGARAYVVTPYARPQLTDGRFSEYEALIGTLALRGLRAGVELISAQQHATHIQHGPFSRIHTAIREGKQIQIEYRSLNNPEAHERTIRPHALIQAGPRWHVRAYCDRAKEFRDFNLGRISRVDDPAHSLLPGAEEDQAWDTLITLRLIPHPHLSAAQAQLVRDEYMAGTVARVFEVRLPVSKYLVQAYRAAVDTSRQLPPDFILAVHKPSELPPGALL